MTSLSKCKTQTNLAITANFLRFEPLTLERMSIASRWIRASLLNTLLARHLELFSGRRLPKKSYHASVFHRILLSIAMQKMKCEWPQPRFLPSHAYSSRVRGCMSGPCNTVLVCFPCAPICLSALRVSFASSIRQCPCLGAIVSGIQKFDFVLADPITFSSTSDRLGERPSARCPDRTTPIARNHVFTSCTDSTTLSCGIIEIDRRTSSDFVSTPQTTSQRRVPTIRSVTSRMDL